MWEIAAASWPISARMLIKVQSCRELHRVITRQLCGVVTRLARSDGTAFKNIYDGALAGVMGAGPGTLLLSLVSVDSLVANMGPSFSPCTMACRLSVKSI